MIEAKYFYKFSFFIFICYLFIINYLLHKIADSISGTLKILKIKFIQKNLLINFISILLYVVSLKLTNFYD